MMVVMAISSSATETIIESASVADGKHQDIEQMVRDHYDGIHRLARHLTRNSDDAADLAQTTFVKACSKIDRYDGRASMRSWLAGILYHEFLHWKRARRLFSSLFDSHSFDPTQAILDRETLLQAIHCLPRKLRDTFILIEVHGFSLTEASLALHVPVGTLKSRQSAARAKLQAILNTEFNHEF